MADKRHAIRVYIPCFCITLKNLTMTFELGRISTCRLPAFSALLIALSASLRTLVLTILAVWDSQLACSRWGICTSKARIALAYMSLEQKECPWKRVLQPISHPKILIARDAQPQILGHRWLSICWREYIPRCKRIVGVDFPEWSVKDCKDLVSGGAR